jgi:hypothetical protein
VHKSLVLIGTNIIEVDIEQDMVAAAIWKVRRHHQYFLRQPNKKLLEINGIPNPLSAMLQTLALRVSLRAAFFETR